MSKSYTLKRSEVINALKTEPLGARGCFIAHDSVVTNKRKCKVCAVGGVLRYIAGKRRSLSAVSGTSQFDQDARNALWSCKHLRNLSTAYECETSGPMTRVRKHMVAWTKKNLPKTMKIQVPEWL